MLGRTREIGLVIAVEAVDGDQADFDNVGESALCGVGRNHAGPDEATHVGLIGNRPYRHADVDGAAGSFVTGKELEVSFNRGLAWLLAHWLACSGRATGPNEQHTRGDEGDHAGRIQVTHARSISMAEPRPTSRPGRLASGDHRYAPPVFDVTPMSFDPHPTIDALRSWYLDRMAPHGLGELTTVEAFNPATGAEIASIPVCDASVVDAVVAAARAAQPPWASSASAARSRVLLAMADAVEAATDELVPLLAFETGKAVRTECVGEVGLLVEILRYFAGLTHEVKGHTTKLGDGILGFVTRHPHGVVGGIVPWNVPLMLMGYKVAAPLAAGNVAVVKIPEQATYSLLRVLQIFDEVLPAGVCTFLTGDGDVTGRALVSNRGVDKISFTGSVDTGRDVGIEAARRIRPVTLELGGKSPMIVLADCDVDLAVDGIVRSMRFTRGGQSCTAASRVYVHRSMLDAVQTSLGAQLDTLVLGPPLDERTDCGPLVSARQRDSVIGFIDEARTDGLDVRRYGQVAPDADLEGGYYVHPHAVFEPPPHHRVAKEEIFGPVVCIFAYDDVNEALAAANDSEFGLSASVWGRDVSMCLQLADQLQAGIVQINQNAIMVPGIAYGGIKNSGVGMESSLEAMLESYTWSKTNILNFGNS